MALCPNNPTVDKACCYDVYRYSLQNVKEFGHLPILLSLLLAYNGQRVKLHKKLIKDPPWKPEIQDVPEKSDSF
jgi:hypothetical protein